MTPGRDDPMIGRTVGNYRLVEVIGRGGMGVVYRAVHKTIVDQVVAVKQLSSVFVLADQSVAQRAEAEAAVQARLHPHPNIVTLYDVEHTEHGVFLVMELVPGMDTERGRVRTLADMVRLQGALAPDEIRRLFAQVLSAVGFAHRQGIVHRDLKPLNVMVTQFGAKVGDFGIAQIVSGETGVSVSGHRVGTPAYMSPEQVLDKKLTTATDIYSLGCTLYEIATGRLPFVESADSSMFEAHLAKRPASPRSVNARIPGALERVIMKAMAKRPEDRYGTCEEFLAALDVAVDEPETRDTVAPKPVGLHVPGVIGVPAGQAEQALLHAGLGVRFDAEEHSEGAPAGVVLRQEPPAGSSLPHGGFVRLVLSRGARPPSLRMPTQRPARPVWRRPVVLVAAVIGAAALAGGFLALCSAPRPRPIPRALRQLGTNVRGGVEYLWSRDSSVMISIPAGRFTMGSDDGDADERPARQVHLDGYLIDKYEVTNRQYEEFCAKTGHAVPEDPGFIDMPDYLATRPDHPVVNVNWEDAKAYATWAGKRLPTEAEWEKAARGTDGRMFPWGDNPMDGAEPANVFDVSAARRLADDSSTVLGYEDGYLTTAPVRACPAGASPYGCLNMIGNVWEWCGDFYSADYYARAPAKNPRGPATGTSRVVRGGSWQDLEMQHLFPRAAYRHSADPSVRAPHVGFRCCLDH